MQPLYFIMLIILLITAFLIGFFLSKYKFSLDKVSREEYDAILQNKIRIETQNQDFASQNEILKTEMKELRESNTRFQSSLSGKNIIIQNLEEKLDSQKSELEKLNERFHKEFENLANKILKSNSEDFNKLSSEKLESILSPLKQNITRFEMKIDENREKNLKESTSLKEQIDQLTKLNRMMTDEAKNLTSALKGESKTRGDWGEMILETVLEKSGLIKDEHYTLQKEFKDSEGARLKPDVIVYLPGDKHLVIDSKLSLIYYEKYSNCEIEEEKTANLRLLRDAMKNHVAGLSQKNYQDLYGINSPDFVMMFVPIEPAFNTALHFDIDIYHESLKKGIVIVTPSTLIATLKIIYNIWRQDSQNKNALKIAESGGRLYDKLAGFLKDMENIGFNIDKSKDSFNQALKKLSSGKGNVITIAEKMKELGAKATKELPASISN